MEIVELSAYITAIFFILLIGFIIWFIFSFSKWADKNLIPAFSKVMGEPGKPVYDVPAPSTKREVLRKDCIDDTKLKCFFFMDVSIITQLYSQIESQQPIKQTKKISTGEKQIVAGNLKSPVGGVEASVGSTNDEQVEIESCFLPNNSSYCKRVMKHLFEDNEVFILDVEERNYKPDIEDTFERCCKTLLNECNAPLPEHWLKIYRDQIREYATSYDDLKKEIDGAWQNKRYVITKGDFMFTQSDNVFTKNIGNNNILLEIPFNPEKAAKERFKILTNHKTGNFTVFGTIEHWDLASSKLTIFPIAMY